jgi:hypothetical protein
MDAAWSTITWPVAPALSCTSSKASSGCARHRSLGIEGGQVRELVRIGELWVPGWPEHPVFLECMTAAPHGTFMLRGAMARKACTRLTVGHAGLRGRETA